MYHADTFHRTITEYPADACGVPIRRTLGQSITGSVVLTVPEADGDLLMPQQDYKDELWLQ